MKKTDDVRLGEGGKSMKCLLCGKNQKLDKSKRSSSGYLKYYRRVNMCSARVTEEAVGSKTRRIDEFYGSVEKRPRVATPPDADSVVNVEQKAVPLSDTNTPEEVTDTVKNE